METLNRTYHSGLLQGKAYSRLHNHLSSCLSRFQLSIPEWKLLGQLTEQPQLSLSELASVLDYDPPMITKLIKILRKKSLVDLKTDSHDSRIKLVSATRKGKDLINKAEPDVRLLLSGILHGLTVDELAVYKKVLQVIIDNTN